MIECILEGVICFLMRLLFLFLKPEYQAALEADNEEQIERDEDENVERKWIPSDEFGEKGDFRTVAVRSITFPRS